MKRACGYCGAPRPCRHEEAHRTAVRAPSSNGKWHLIGFDDTVCGRFVFSNWQTTSVGELVPGTLCGHCSRGLTQPSGLS